MPEPKQNRGDQIADYRYEVASDSRADSAIYCILSKAAASQPGTLRDGQAWLDDGSGDPGGCPWAA